MIVTTNKCWLAGIQFRAYKERFTNQDEAMFYARKLATLRPTDIIEVFVCCNNLMANIPVEEVVETVEVSKP